MPGRLEGREVGDEERRGPGAVGRHDARKRGEGRTAAERLEDPRGDALALAAHDAVDRPAGVFEDIRRDERGTVAANHDPAVGERRLGLARQIDDLGHVGEVVEGEADRVRTPARERVAVVRVPEHLEIEQRDLVTGGLHRGCDLLETERLEAQVYLREHERTRMDEQHAHGRRVS
jgi:hypothetical protein